MSAPIPNTTTQLLFGFLALQNDFITREQLLASFTTWIANKSVPIDQVLVDGGTLPEDERQLVAMLVKKHLAKHHHDAEQSLSAIDHGGLASVLPQLTALRDPDLDKSLQPIDTEFETQIHGESQPILPTERSSAGRYRIMRPHAKGGLGEVFLAFDQELMREVALKEIQPRYADDAASRSRFMLEAEVTGGLEHPGIVPVYGLGSHDDGRPYYAMRFVRGKSLKESVDEFYKKIATDKSTGPSETAVAWRQLLGYFVSVCHAIEYAHSRGVLHRDVKPSNVMIGRFGEALVVDWGLAKVRGRGVAAQDTGDVTLKPTSGDSSETRAGSAIGTPAFMSPEQAMGHHDDVGPTADIYSLGATLYYMLTGETPFGHDNVASTLQKVMRGEFNLPRDVRPKVSRSLEAVCLRAMALEPKKRYQTARDLANDLELWLADEPVSVYRGSISERSGRWMRRHRGMVQTAATGLALVTLLSILAAFVFMNLQAEAQLERHNALVAKGAAETAREEAEKLAADNRTLAQQKEAARAAAQQLATSNAELASREASGRQLAERLAEDMRLEADKSRRLSEFLIRTFQASDPIGQGAAPGFLPKEKGGELTAREMLDLGADRLADDEELGDYPLTKAAVMEAIGDAYRQLGIFESAEPLLIAALETRRKLLPPHHADLASSLHNLGWYYHERGNYPEASSLYDQALAIRRKLPGDEGRRLVANTLHNKAWMLANEGWADEAEVITREAFQIRQKTLGDGHRDTIFSQFALCFILIEQDKYLEAAVQMGLVSSKLSRLKADPKVTQAASEFAWGVINRELLGSGASEKHLRTALASCIEGLGADNVYVAVIHCELGTTLESLGKVDEALEQFALSMKIAREKVALEHPRIVILASRYSNLLAENGRAEEGRAIWDDFMTAQRRRFDPRYGQILRASVAQARFLRKIKDYEAAFDLLKDSIETIRRAANENSGYRYEVGLLGDALNQQGLCLLDSETNFETAAQLFRESIEAYRQEPLPLKVQLNLVGWPQINLVSALTSLGDSEGAEIALGDSRKTIEMLRGGDRKQLLEYHLENSIELQLVTENLDKLQQAATDLLPLYLGHPGESTSRDMMRLCNSLCRGVETAARIKDSSNRDNLVQLALRSLQDALTMGYPRERASTWKALSVLRDETGYQEALKPPSGDSSIDPPEAAKP